MHNEVNPTKRPVFCHLPTNCRCAEKKKWPKNEQRNKRTQSADNTDEQKANHRRWTSSAATKVDSANAIQTEGVCRVGLFIIIEWVSVWVAKTGSEWVNQQGIVCGAEAHRLSAILLGNHSASRVADATLENRSRQQVNTQAYAKAKRKNQPANESVLGKMETNKSSVSRGR